MANQQINYRNELVKMLKYLRKIKPRYFYHLNRLTYKTVYPCSNGQDVEAIYLRDSITVGELKKFLKDIPDDLTVDAFEDRDYDGESNGVLLRFEYEQKYSDEQYYRQLLPWYNAEKAKEKAKDIPIPTEEEYHEMLAKIKRYADAKVNYVSC
jgi:hypothetical protein